jgi:hypothetical protein
MAPESTLTASTAERMVEHLFDDAVPTRFDEALCVGAGLVEMVNALTEWAAESPARSLPNIRVVSGESGSRQLKQKFPDVIGETHSEIFLGREPAFEESFDFILCNPPQIDWENLDPQRKTTIAETSAHIAAGETPESVDILYLEKAVLSLSTDGIGVFLPQRQLKHHAPLAPYRKEFSAQAIDAEPITESHTDRMLITIVGTEPDQFDGTPLSLTASPAEIEESLVNDGRQANQSGVSEILTPLDKMDVYNADADSAFVYLDLLYEDYDASLVYESPEKRENLNGFVARASLDPDSGTTAAAVAQPMSESAWLSVTASIGQSIEKLSEHRFAFVGTSENIRGIVTRFDLNRMPVYMYLYDMFAQFEIKLRQCIRDRVTNWQRYCRRGFGRREELVADELAQESLGTLTDIVEQEGLDTTIVSNLDEFDARFDDLRRLRNAVAHYNPLVHTMTDEPTWDDPRRGAAQFGQEHALLQAAISRLPEQSADL